MTPMEDQELRQAWRERLDDLLKERVHPALVVDEIMATIQHYAADGSFGDQLLAVVEGRAVFNASGFVVSVRDAR